MEDYVDPFNMEKKQQTGFPYSRLLFFSFSMTWTYCLFMNKHGGLNVLHHFVDFISMNKYHF